MPTLVDDRYELLEVLASGGMATVWRARDIRLGRLVALKRPHPASAESMVHERMEREARAAAGVNHPNLVTMFDTGHDEDGPYLVMELVGGPTLASPGREIGPSEAVAIGAQIADALAAVHQAGIIHRDVKPSNVILSERGPCLTDFGIASIDGATRELTQPGTIMATPSYAAPEVLAGDPPSPASDVFSLAAVVYGLVRGTPPFQGTDRTSLLTELGDPQLDAVIRAGLATDPSQRPTARELAAGLRASAPTQAVAAPNNTLLLPVPIDPAPIPATDATASLPDANDIVVSPTLPPGEPAPTPEPVSQPPPTKIAESGGPEPADDEPSRLRLGPILLVAAVLALVAWAARSPVEPAENVSTTTDIVSTTRAPVTTSAPTTVPVDPVIAARDRLATVLAGIGPPELKPKDRAEIMEKVDKAIANAREDPEEAENEIREAAESIGNELKGDPQAEAIAALADVAGALGLAFDPEAGGGD